VSFTAQILKARNTAAANAPLKDWSRGRLREEILMRKQTEDAFQKAFGSLPASSCEMTEGQKAMVATWVTIYLQCADLAMTLACVLQERHVGTQLAGRGIRHIDAIVAKTGLRGNDSRLKSVLELRDTLTKHSEPLPEEIVKSCVQSINNIIDMAKPLEPLMNSVINYASKLAIIELDIERVFAAIEDIRFARALAVELDA
jgi:hypothetical protein